MNKEKLSNEILIQKAITSVAKGGLLLTIGAILAKFFIFLRQFVIIRFLSPADYGLFSLGLTLVTLYILIGSIGLQAGAQRGIAFYYEKGDLPNVRGIIISSIRILVISSALVSLIMIVLSQPLSNLFAEPEFKSIQILFVPIVPLTISINLVAAFYMGFERPGIRTFVEYIGVTSLSLILILVMLLLYRSIKAAIVGMIISYLIMLLISLAYSLRNFPIKLYCMERRKMGRELLSFSLPLLATFSLNYFMVQSDTLMLGYFSTAKSLGIYNAAFVLSVFVGILLYPVSSIFISVASGLVAKESHIELRETYRLITKWLFFFSAPIFIILFFFPSQVLGFTFGSEYQSAARALQILCLGEFAFCITGPNVGAIIAYGRSKILMIVFAVSAGINILLNILLIPRLGINGAAIASSTALTLSNILCSFYLFFKHKTHPFTKKYLLPVFVFITLSLLLFYPFEKLLALSTWALLAYYPLFLAVALISAFLFKGLEPMDRNFLNAIFNRYKTRKR